MDGIMKIPTAIERSCRNESRSAHRIILAWLTLLFQRSRRALAPLRAAVIYAILTLIPGTEHMAAKIGAIGAATLFAALWKQIKGIFD